MALTYNTVQVNSGNTGWTRPQVLDALGQVFQNLGFHAPATTFLGSNSVIPPGNGWSSVGGNIGSLTSTTYYTYVVPDSGSRKGGRFKITRNTSGNVINVEVEINITPTSARNQTDGTDPNGYTEKMNGLAMGEGWSDEEVFEIPADAIGGAANGATNIQFGAPGNTTPSISVYQSNANGSPWFWYDEDSYYPDNNASHTTDLYPVAIMKLTHDAAKKFGSTYWAFRFSRSSVQDYSMDIICGTSIDVSEGGWGGVYGVDCGSGYDYNYSISQYQYTRWGPSEDGNVGSEYSTYNVAARKFKFAETTAPTQYPLNINYASDGDFAVIDFTQSKNSAELPYYAFWMYKGTGLYNGLVDLDYLCLDAWGPIVGYDQGIKIGFGSLGTSSGTSFSHTPVLTLDYVHGFQRFAGRVLTNKMGNADMTDGTDDGAAAIEAYYSCPIRESRSVDETFGQTSHVLYYRNSASEVGNILDSSTDFYRPYAGIPLTTSLFPIPGYMPDDFALIPFEVTPPGTLFRPGDTITVSASEVYTIIRASYTVNEESTYSRGMAFCVRTT